MIIQPNILQKVLDASLGTGADFADVFIENTWSSHLAYLDQKPNQAVVKEVFGAGVRLFFGHEIVYVTTNDLSEEGLLTAAKKAAQLKKSQSIRSSRTLKNQPIESIHRFGVMPWERRSSEKIRWLKNVDQWARGRSSLVSQVSANLLEVFQKVQIANSEGVLAYDERANCRLAQVVYAENQGNKESFTDNVGHFGTSEIFESMDAKTFAETLADKAVMMTTAGFAPAGEMPVLIDNGFGGVVFHEACGHGLETTAVAKEASVFCGRLGEKVAHESVTAIDDGTIPHGWGSLNVDDEGRPTQRTVLIEKGILKSYIVDEMGSRQTGFAPTGSARKQSYKFAPASRMRNTFIAPGTDSFEEMVRDVDHGLYAKKMGGGSVNPATGDFNFAVVEAYRIRNGRIEEPVKGATLIGRGIDTLGKIVKVSSDLRLATGMCGSVSGLIPAAVGQPQILVSSMLVGGRA